MARAGYFSTAAAKAILSVWDACVRESDALDCHPGFVLNCGSKVTDSPVLVRASLAACSAVITAL